MSDFANLTAAAQAIATGFADLKADLVLAVAPNGVEIGLALANQIQCDLRPVIFDRENGTVEVDLTGIETDARIVLTDDGVESGKAASAIGAFLKSKGFTEVALVVPVCARDAAAQLQFHFTSVSALIQPMMTRALSWHYAEVPNQDLAVSLQMIAERNR